MTGYTTQDIVGKSLRILHRNDAHQPGLAEIRRILSERRDGHATMRNYRKDGTLFWSTVHISPVMDSTGEVSHFVAAKYDVTEIKHADTAMYHAKEAGRNNFQLFTPELKAKAFRRMRLESDLRRAVEKDEFALHYQPQVSLKSGKICGMEVLIRWQHPELGIEITENIAMTNADQTIDTLRALKELGLQLSIDDFGTGYSSLSYLTQFPIDILKIDQTFVHDITAHSNSAAVVSSIITLAHNLRLEVIAEGVETEAQLSFLQSNGCDLMQGYYFSKPLPADEFEYLLRIHSGIGEVHY